MWAKGLDRAWGISDDGGMGRTQSGVVLLGGGGHARVVGECLRLIGLPVAGVCDDDATPAAGEPPLSLARLGPLMLLADDPGFLSGRSWILAVGDLGLRRRLLDGIGQTGEAEAVVHPSARVSPSCAIGSGSWIGPGAITHTACAIGEHAIVNSGAIVEHDCRVGENVHLAPGSVIGGGVRIGRDTLIGLGARVMPGVSIGAGCVVGAGAAVTSDLPDGVTAVGVPAQVLGSR